MDICFKSDYIFHSFIIHVKIKATNLLKCIVQNTQGELLLIMLVFHFPALCS